MRIQGALLILASVISGSAAAGDASSQGMSRADFDEFLHRYYLKPQPEKAVVAIAYLDARDDASLVNAQIPITVFFSHIYAATPGIQDDLVQAIKGVEDQRLQKLLMIAVSNSPETLTSSLRASAEKNDAYWACFFATGDATCLDPLVAALKYMSERSDINLFGVGSSAKWSLAANLRDHPAVRARVETATKDQDPVIRAQAEQVLHMTVEEIQKESVDIVRANHLKGTW